MTTTILTFGKFKGTRFCDTPKWYQEWATKQSGFMARLSASGNNEPIPPKRPAYWDGYSRNGQAWEMEHFEFEQRMAEKSDHTWSWLYEGI